MSWDKWDITYWGRTAGALIIIGGIALAAWIAQDLPRGVSTSFAARYFLLGVLGYAFWGFIVILVAELAYRMNWRGEEATEEPDDATSEEAELPPLLPIRTVWAYWNNLNLVQLGRIAGGLITIVGTIVSAWNAFDHQQGPLDFANIGAAKYFLANVLQYAFYGFLVIVLAELVNQIGWRGAETAAESDETRDTALPAS